MTFRTSALACLLLFAASASAQMRIEPLQPAATPSPAQPRIEPLPEATPSAVQPQVQPLEATPGAVELNTEEARLKRRIVELEQETASLRDANAELRQRVRNFTSLGGSEVHAYCSATTISSNTAGKTRECAPYSCNEVTGQCLDSCTVATDCGGVNANCVEGKCSFERPPIADPDDD